MNPAQPGRLKWTLWGASRSCLASAREYSMAVNTWGMPATAAHSMQFRKVHYISTRQYMRYMFSSICSWFLNITSHRRNHPSQQGPGKVRAIQKTMPGGELLGRTYLSLIAPLYTELRPLWGAQFRSPEGHTWRDHFLKIERRDVHPRSACILQESPKECTHNVSVRSQCKNICV